MKKGMKIFMGVLLAAGGLICIGVASYILVFEDTATNIPLEGEDKNAALATVHNVVYTKGEALEVSSESSMCLDYGRGCTVTTPSIVTDELHEVVGWSEDKEGKGTVYKEETEITVSSDITLHAIIKEKAKSEIKLEIDNICSKDLKCNIGNKVVDTACSQVGYVEKNTDSSLEDCAANPGINNYQKFGNNGNIWDAAFINWVFSSSKISLKDKGIEDVDSVSSYIKWSKNNNRWYTSKSALNNGDLVLTNNDQHIGIAVNIDNEWYMIKLK